MMKRIYILAVALVLALMPAAAQDVSKQEEKKAKPFSTKRALMHVLSRYTV